MIKQWRKRAAVLCLAAVFAAGTGGVLPKLPAAYGAESSVIENLTVTVKAGYGEPGEILEPEIQISGKGCSVGEISYGTKHENWKPGRKVRAEIRIHADDGKYFPDFLDESHCKVNGAQFLSAKALDKTTLLVKADFIPVMVLGETKEAGWSEKTKTKAVWDKVDGAPGYVLALYKDGKLKKRLNVETNSIDLVQYIDDLEKIYYYEVKAAPQTSSQKKYLKEGKTVVSPEQEFFREDYAESHINNSIDGGSVKGDNYVLPGGEKAANIWKKFWGNWYYFGSDGKQAKGWLNVGGSWYYLDQDGIMQTGWVEPTPDVWYYLASDGRMQTGWVQPSPGTWYYMDAGGKMTVNVTVDGWNIGPDGVAHPQT